MASTKPIHPFVRRRGSDDQNPAREKLALEIRGLRRSPWAQPVVLVPLFVTLVTVGLSQYLGVFDVERKRIELLSTSAEVRNREAELRYREIQLARELSQREILELEGQREALKSERLQLLKDRDQLVERVAVLRVESRDLAVQRGRIEEDDRLAKERHEMEQQKFTDNAEDRLDRVVTMLADADPAKRQAAVMSLQSYLAGGHDAHRLKAMLALSGALALEESVGVRSSLVSAIADVDAPAIGPAIMTSTLQALVRVNRGLVQEIQLRYGWPSTELKQERKWDANLQATADAISAMLRKGVRTQDLSTIYLGEVDLSHLDLTGSHFDGSVLIGADFSGSTLQEASFDSADLMNVTFKNADLRSTRFTFPFILRKSKTKAIRRNYVDDRLYIAYATELFWKPPDYRCADLRGADFSGYPLLAVFDNEGSYNWFGLWAPSFEYANLQGANFTDVQGFGIWPSQGIKQENSDEWGIPFGVNGGLARRFTNGHSIGMFSIDPKKSLAADVSRFSRSLGYLTEAFNRTNWEDARLPLSLREWLNRHRLEQRPQGRMFCL
jgi:uncharacterized protein YjbI with pentapeptide repeats